jgi:hypothetical protein
MIVISSWTVPYWRNPSSFLGWQSLVVFTGTEKINFERPVQQQPSLNSYSNDETNAEKAFHLMIY